MLTLCQNKAYQFIKDYIESHGHSPSMTEIAIGIGIKSRGVAHRYVHALARKGFLRIIPGCHRNIELVSMPDKKFHLPIVGRIAAGTPIEAINHEEAVNLFDAFLGANRFALQVKGDSMIDEGILDGDIVVCERTSTAREGQIVVALVDNQEATLKRLKYNPNKTVSLLSSNPNYQPLVYEPDQVQIQGIFVGLVRLPISGI